MTTRTPPRSTDSASTVGWVVAGAVSVSVLVAAALMPVTNGQAFVNHLFGSHAPSHQGTLAATTDADTIVLPQHGVIPRAEARLVTATLICPLYNAVDDLRGCVKADGSPLLAPVVVPNPVTIAERCGQTADSRACEPYRISGPE